MIKCGEEGEGIYGKQTKGTPKKMSGEEDGGNLFSEIDRIWEGG